MTAKHIRRVLVPAAAVLALAACSGTDPRTQLADRATRQLVGMNKAQLLACAGVPDKQATVNGDEIYTYLRDSPFATPSPSTAIGVQGSSAGGATMGVGASFPLFALSSPGGCRADVVLRNGTVARLGYGDGSNPADCADIVDNCLPPAP
ncbi:hypothetical protein M2352_000140 [Azospirillum fermentarium]|uniref:hypothetical protein n=1 Tax=Azospirillum fermentarium TaxID=1233114 RepID=UPI0022275C66|nr:hypothetical protein [Azospirillum fermentarium]MCW2244549.1 hypothetical protein [Azospirillum fermentarium]